MEEAGNGKVAFNALPADQRHKYLRKMRHFILPGAMAYNNLDVEIDEKTESLLINDGKGTQVSIWTPDDYPSLGWISEFLKRMSPFGPPSG